MSATKAGLGRCAEAEAARFLESAGYRIVTRNYRARGAEIDIIAFDRGGVICFIEVRSKSTPAFGTAAESITRAKRARISLAAVQYLKEKGALERKARFDVVCIGGNEGTAGIRLITNAFEFEGEY